MDPKKNENLDTVRVQYKRNGYLSCTMLFLACLPYFEKKNKIKGGLRDHLAVSVPSPYGLKAEIVEPE
jgi:hypothetical protein